MMARSGEALGEVGEVTHVSFVLIPRFNMMTLTMLMEPMRIANYLAPHKLYEWDFRATATGQVLASNGLNISCHHIEEEGLPRPNIIAVCGSWGAEHLDDPLLFRWLRRCARAQAQMIAVELGIYAFANAGLITDQKVTTHWSMMDVLTSARR